MKKLVLLFIVAIGFALLLLIPLLKTQIPKTEVVTPMGHKMEYIRHIDEFLYEYRDSYTGIHYIVSIVDGRATVYRPLFRNHDMELIISIN